MPFFDSRSPTQQRIAQRARLAPTAASIGPARVGSAARRRCRRRRRRCRPDRFDGVGGGEAVDALRRSARARFLGDRARRCSRPCGVKTRVGPSSATISVREPVEFLAEALVVLIERIGLREPGREVVVDVRDLGERRRSATRRSGRYSAEGIPEAVEEFARGRARSPRAALQLAPAEVALVQAHVVVARW